MTINIRFFQISVTVKINGVDITDFHRLQELLGANAQDDNPYLRYLCGALRSDFQSVRVCDKVLGDIALIRRNESEPLSYAGNSFITEVFPTRVEICHVLFLDYGWKTWVCDLETFELALRAWREFLLLPRGEINEVILELPERDFSYKDE